MKRVVLFSVPTATNIQKILDAFFPPELENRAFAYMPSDGANSKQKYADLWQAWVEGRGATFVPINNSLEGDTAATEAQKLLTCDVLCMTGGNTYTLLRNLRRSGMDKAVVKFAKKDNFVIGGFSAGAIVLSPTIGVCEIEGFDANTVGLTNLTALSLINFEVFPHYEEKWKEQAASYERHNNLVLKRVTDEDVVVIDL